MSENPSSGTYTEGLDPWKGHPVEGKAGHRRSANVISFMPCEPGVFFAGPTIGRFSEIVGIGTKKAMMKHLLSIDPTVLPRILGVAAAGFAATAAETAVSFELASWLS